MPYTEVPNTTDEETKTSDYAVKNEPSTNLPLQFDESLFMDKIKQFNSNSEASSEVGEPNDTNEEPEEFDITQFEEALIEDQDDTQIRNAVVTPEQPVEDNRQEAFR